MKKALFLALAGGFVLSNIASAQQRLSLYEEFSGENCAPCAAVNPGLWTLMQDGTNPSKVLMIKYQTPIPSAGPIYNLYKIDSDNRRNYYGVNFAPWGNMDGKLPLGFAGPGSQNSNFNPYYLQQTHIDSSTNNPTNFTIATHHEWFANGDSVRVFIDVTATNALTTTDVKLRVALIESLYYDVAPGTNGETEFHNVVRRMYPSPSGTSIINSWATNQTENFVVEGAVPNYVDKSSTVFMAVWLQEDNDKSILQAARTDEVTLAEDVLVKSNTTPGILCEAPSLTGHKVKLINKGTSAITSADIHSGFTTKTVTNWTGNLAPNDTVEVSIPSITVPANASTYSDSLGLINGGKDFNTGNNIHIQYLKLFSNPATNLPGMYNAESALPATWTVLNNELKPNEGANDWFRATLPTASADPFGTKGIIAVQNAGGAGKSSYLLLPYTNIPEGQKALDFWYSYGNRGNAALTDELQVVASKDCGATWNVIWNAKGDDLANGRSSAQNSYFIPKQGEWSHASVDVTSLTGVHLLGFRSVSNDNNYIFLDNVELRSGAVGIEEVVLNTNLTIAPNPVKDQAQIKFDLSNNSNVAVEVTNLIGQRVQYIAPLMYTNGQNTITLNTANLPAGVYMVNVITDQGIMTSKMVK